MRIDPHALHHEELPEDPATRAQIFSGRILVDRDEHGQLFAYEDIAIPEIDPGVPLRHALLSHEYNKYPLLMDQRAMPTDEERTQFPAIYCHAALRAGGNLTPYEVARELVAALKKKRSAFSSELQQALHVLEDTIEERAIKFDRRLREPLSALVSCIQAEGFPLTFEDIKARSTDPETRKFYYGLKYTLRKATVLLHWYEVPTLYIQRVTEYNDSYDNPITLRYTILSSDRHKAEVELASNWLSGQNDPDLITWELLANDTPIQVLTRERETNYQVLSPLWGEWERRSDDDIDFWLQ